MYPLHSFQSCLLLLSCLFYSSIFVFIPSLLPSVVVFRAISKDFSNEECGRYISFQKHRWPFSFQKFLHIILPFLVAICPFCITSSSHFFFWILPFLTIIFTPCSISCISYSVIFSLNIFPFLPTSKATLEINDCNFIHLFWNGDLMPFRCRMAMQGHLASYWQELALIASVHHSSSYYHSCKRKGEIRHPGFSRTWSVDRARCLS